MDLKGVCTTGRVATVLAAVAVTSPVLAVPPRVVVDDGHPLLCWRDGLPTTEEVPLERVVALPYASLTDVSLISVSPLFPGEGACGSSCASFDASPQFLQVSTLVGKAALSECLLGWIAPMIPQAEGSRREIVVLPPDRQPYLAAIRTAVGRPTFVVDRLSQVDLDGDGSQEVVFSGAVGGKPSRQPANSSSGRRGTSIVGVLSESGRVLLKAENRDHPSQPGVSVLGATDVEGDGRLELVLYTRGDHWARFTFVVFAQSKVSTGYQTAITW